MDPISIGLMGGGLLLSGLGSIFGRGKARKEARRAQQMINNYDRFEPTNAYQDMPISTLGSDILREEAGRTTATLADAAIAGGTRGVFGALPQIMEIPQRASREAALMMDRQLQDKNRMVAADQTRIQQEYLQRDRENLAGLGAQYNAAKQQEADYTRGLINLPMAAASMFSGALGQGGGTTPGSSPTFMPINPNLFSSQAVPFGDYSVQSWMDKNKYKAPF